MSDVSVSSNLLLPWTWVMLRGEVVCSKQVISGFSLDRPLVSIYINASGVGTELAHVSILLSLAAEDIVPTHPIHDQLGNLTGLPHEAIGKVVFAVRRDNRE